MKQSTEDLISGAAAAGWDWFDRAEALFGDRSALSDRQEDKRRRLAEAAARVLESDDGRLLFSHLKAATIDRVTFVTQLGVDPQQALLYGAFREGQNALFVAVAKLAHEGRQDPAETAPTRRD